MNLDALVTAPEAASVLPDVCRHLIGMWRFQGKLHARGKRGRSPLYRYGDVLQVEMATRRSGFSHRTLGCASCDLANRQADPAEQRVA